MSYIEEGIFDFSSTEMFKLSMGEEWFALSLLMIGRLGVPIFLMITGYLLLDRYYSTKDILGFCKMDVCIFYYVYKCGLSYMIWFYFCMIKM